MLLSMLALLLESLPLMLLELLLESLLEESLLILLLSSLASLIELRSFSLFYGSFRRSLFTFMILFVTNYGGKTFSFFIY